ncbi:MAG: D-alanyl-D-alanine carboxypeptidase family protein [Clostridia bacterium]|nr:D-alanyl-D-alanine carboxypeptidase family protein [Clostridia bacterium]
MRALTLHTNNIGRGGLILVNPSHPIRYETAKENLMALCPDYPSVFLERQAVSMLAQAITAANCGNQIVPVSGYRTEKEQQSLYTDSLRENGRSFTQKFVALPGCSEHQTGLAIDLAENTPDIDFIRPHFHYTGICQTFRKKSVRYGFIERYPAGREQLTHIAHKSWHFRYVGYPHSELMREKELTMEEYTDYIKGFPYNGIHLQFHSVKWDFAIYYVPILSERQVDIKIPDKALYQISGNNVDGFVVTLWGNSE